MPCRDTPVGQEGGGMVAASSPAPPSSSDGGVRWYRAASGEVVERQGKEKGTVGQGEE